MCDLAWDSKFPAWYNGWPSTVLAAHVMCSVNDGEQMEEWQWKEGRERGNTADGSARLDAQLHNQVQPFKGLLDDQDSSLFLGRLGGPESSLNCRINYPKQVLVELKLLSLYLTVSLIPSLPQLSSVWKQHREWTSEIKEEAQVDWARLIGTCTSLWEIKALPGEQLWN